MVPTVANYLSSDEYDLDLEATLAVWTSKHVLGTAGLFIFLSYITMPLLLKVQPGASHERMVVMKAGLDRKQEKEFLCRMLGLESEPEWAGGFRNPRVQQMIANLGRQHRGFNAMDGAYMNYFAAIIALSALEVHVATASGLTAETRSSYWRYMRQAMLVLGCELGELAPVRSACIQFAAEHAAPSAMGAMLLAGLTELYPAYVQRALPILFGGPQQALRSLIAEGSRPVVLEAAR